MDYNTELENAKQKLLQLGFTEEKYNQLLELAAEELIDRALIDLQEKDLPLLEELERNLVPEPTNIEEANKNIELIFVSAYGEQAELKRQEMLMEYLNTTIQQTITTKDLIERYQAGDPTAIATIESSKNHPDVQEVLKLIDEQSNNNVTNIGGETENPNVTPEPFPQPITE